MLYEVITKVYRNQTAVLIDFYRNLGLLRNVDARNLKALQKLEPSNNQGQQSRITSYNVCYTKLLRQHLDIIGVDHIFFYFNGDYLHGAIGNSNNHSSAGGGFGWQQHRFRGIGQQSRITSYNVCYTKLLRKPQAIRCQPNACAILSSWAWASHCTTTRPR